MLDNKKAVLARTGPEEIEGLEVIGLSPHWLVRWGIPLLSVGVALLFLVAHNIKYPDTISMKATLVGEGRSATVITPRKGSLVALFVGDDEPVCANDYLVAINTIASLQDIVQLRSNLEKLSTILIQPSDIAEYQIFQKRLLNLGELQASYLSLMKIISDFGQLSQSTYYADKTRRQQSRITRYRDLEVAIISEQQVLFQELEAASQKYLADSTLFSKGLLSKARLSESNNYVLKIRKSIARLSQDIIENRLRLSEQQEALQNLHAGHRNEERRLLVDIQESYENLRDEFMIWEREHIIKASIGGRTSFHRSWQIGQELEAHTKIMRIIQKPDRLTANAYINTGEGKHIIVGQNVSIKIDGYPLAEYGSVAGSIDSIVPVSKQEHLVKILMPSGLWTSKKRLIDFKVGLQGVAKIEIEKRSILQYVFGALHSRFAGKRS